MHFPTLVLSGLFALASAQSTGSATDAETPTTTYALTPQQSSDAACLAACSAGDVNCQSHCVTVPSPNESQVNATNNCVAACPQGSGTPSDTETYSNCVQGCINDYYYQSSAGTPEATGASGSGSGSSSGAAPTASGASGASGSSATGKAGSSATATSGSESGSSTETAASTTHTGAASAMVGSSAALFGVVAALLAL